MVIKNSPFEAIVLHELQARQSEKWSTYGHDILPAHIAEMDFALAPAVAAALQAAIERNDCGYARPVELGLAFARFGRDHFRWEFQPGAAFAVPDVMAGVAQSIYVLSTPEDSVVVNTPVYYPFFETIRMTGRNMVDVPLAYNRHTNEWALDFKGLEAAFARGARFYLLCNPHNPVGRAWPASNLTKIAALADAYHVTIISDEIHAPLVMPGIYHTTFGAADPSFTNYVTVFSASKAWNIAGLKCAVLYAGSEALSAKVDQRFKEIPSEVRDRVGHLGAIATIAAFNDGALWLGELCEQLDRNRKLLAQLVREHLPDVRYTPPEATFLAWLDCSRLASSDFGELSPATYFLERGQVALQDGAAFGPAGANFVRLNIGTSSSILREIVQRMGRAVHA